MSVLHCPNPECPYLERHGSPAEYREGFERCSDCGGPLVSGEWVRPAQEERLPPKSGGSPLVLLMACADNIEASGVSALLDANGIDSVLQGEHAHAVLGVHAAHIGVNVLVGEADLRRAREVLREAAASEAEDAEPDDPQAGAAPDDPPGVPLGRERRGTLRWAVMILFGIGVTLLVALALS